MPTKSPSQKRLMQAAAHTPGGYGGVSQKVGAEFVAADKAKGSPKSRDDHMARKAKHEPQRSVGKDFGKSQSTVSRGVMRQGFNRIGSA